MTEEEEAITPADLFVGTCMTMAQLIADLEARVEVLESALFAEDQRANLGSMLMQRLNSQEHKVRTANIREAIFAPMLKTGLLTEDDIDNVPHTEGMDLDA